MHLSQMFPKKSLDAADLAAMNQGYTVVTIEQFDFKTHEARNPGDAEISYYLYFREFKKPMRLNQTNAYNIAEVLGSQNANDWIGKTISIRPHYHKMTDAKTKRTINIWIFDVDLAAPTTAPLLPPKQDITGLSGSIPGGPKPGVSLPPATAPGQLPAAAPTEAAPIGIDKAADLIAALRERGKTTDDLLKHMSNAGMSHLVAGKIPPDWPAAALPACRAFCKMFPKAAAPPGPTELENIKQMWRPPPAPATPEVIDHKTGEVINAGGHAPIDEDDIPF